MLRSSARALAAVSAFACVLLAAPAARAVVDAVRVDVEILALAAGGIGVVGLTLFPRVSRGRARDGGR
jgi:hypothetical protein